MIGDVTRAIVQAIENARQGTPFAATEIRADAGSPEPPPPGVTVTLVSAAIDHATRDTPMRASAQAAEQGIILHYVITPRADPAGTQHDMLGWLLRTMRSAPVITAGAGSIRLSVVTLPLETETRLWLALHPGRPLLPSLHVEARTALGGSHRMS